MKYWPISTIAASPLASHPGFQWELSQAYRAYSISPAGFRMCTQIALNTPAAYMPTLAIVESFDTPSRQVFTEYPDWEEWVRLERGAVIEGDNGMLVILIDALH